jgi:hypothetical protein
MAKSSGGPGALTDDCRARIRALFSGEDCAAAEAILEAECGTSLPFMDGASPEALDRVRFAAIRLSGGRLPQLTRAVQLAKTDWRDLLVAAGFADHPGAHWVWEPRRLTQSVIEGWMQRELVAGVDFQVGDRVRVADGIAEPMPGAVVALVALEPEPQYRIALDSGAEVEIYQWSLKSLEPANR